MEKLISVLIIIAKQQTEKFLKDGKIEHQEGLLLQWTKFMSS